MKKELSHEQISENPVYYAAFGFGAGFAKKAPGTVGTIMGIPIYLLTSAGGFPVFVVLTVLFSLLGIYLCGETAKALGVHDHPGIVWDEIVGFMVTMLLVPFSWSAVFVGFVLFRFFDIIKPWPISYVDKHIDGGLGIMLDDLLAGLFSALILSWIVSSGWL
ncbi:MAG: phosphatidylglycerophosphatase A [Gammaproteobacteria bacterium]|nr:MAG: phosphatidylglycerophosphatase A [Gammaproteobacteria bacterium]